MRHSCGHTAPRDMPKQVVRSVPRCADCQGRRELQASIDKYVATLALYWPNTSADSFRQAIRYGAHGNLHKQLERARMFVENAYDSYELERWLSSTDKEQYAHHAMTGD